MQVYGFKRSWPKTIFTFIAYILTIGCVRLFFHWYPYFHLHAMYSKCALSQAVKVLIIDDYQGKYKSYFVKDVKIISMSNLSSNALSTSCIPIENDQLIQGLQGKDLKISLLNGTKTGVPEYRAFWCKKLCYIWDNTRCEFSKLTGLDSYINCSDLNKEKNDGLAREEQILRRIVYGNNEILVPVQSIGVLLVLEILNPFYIFQIFTLGVWLPEGYVYYSVAIVCMSVFGIASSILQTRKSQTSLRNTVASTETIKVLRHNGEFESISSVELVPGDIIELPKHHGLIVCDAVLLSGTCIVNESMLTGESVPVTKTPLQPQPVLYSSKEFPHNTLFCGTTIIQTKNFGGKPVLAKVIRTGLLTNKGSLVAAILYPPPADFKFDQDSYKFMGILAVVALGAFLYTVISKATKGIPALSITSKALDIITIVIPPALPAVMTVGKLYAQSRLKRQKIYCVNTRAINVSGSINCVCFDKTGTLTEDGLDMMGVVKNDNNSLSQPEKCSSTLRNHRIFEGMLVCHSLTIIEGELSGDPLDAKMFESTGWTLEEPEIEELKEINELQAMAVIKPPKNEILTENMNTFSEISIVQQYQFSSTLQRMSVIAQRRGSNEFRAYTKGSPEMILSLSKPDSIPSDIATTLQKYTEQGYRVIAIGYSEIDADQTEIQKTSREMVEKDLEFLGLIILENRLKSPTVKVIKELREANIQTIMITGDNIQTAVSVAKECGILSHEETVINVNIVAGNNNVKPDLFFNIQSFSSKNKELSSTTSSIESIERGLTRGDYKFALTGITWQLLREHYFDILSRICIKGAVFARMTSDQKQQLVVELMQLGYYVVMCGDGANDCGALRAAHVGISLSEAESSVASPFTSRIPDIRCVPTIIQQGRAALVTSFGIFKFMVNYSLTEFVSTVILYSIDSNLADFEFLFIDIFLAVNFAFFFGKTKAYTGKLNRTPPMTSLISFAPLFSLASQIFLIITFQATAFYGVQLQPWFTPYHMKDDQNYSCYENYSVYCISMFQYMILAVVFSRGKPYRKPIYTNYTFLASLLTMLAVCLYITLSPAQWIANLMQLMVPPVFNWRLVILGLALINFAISFCVEYVLVEWAIERMIKVRMHKPEKSKKMYLRLQHDLQRDPNWPPISSFIPVLPITPSVGQMLNSSRKVSMCQFYNSHLSSSADERQPIKQSQIEHNSVNEQKKCFDNLAFIGDDSVTS
ncbi:probable cation-transporting ATPase 13A3 isoform X2 [Nasonia vitripennis]|nr:probable cation-transporting ATPase 13A3 isoform X2 [Nasonia vitripennis]